MTRLDSLAVALRCSTTAWLVGVQKDYRLRDPGVLSRGAFDSGIPYGATLRLLDKELTRREAAQRRDAAHARAAIDRFD